MHSDISDRVASARAALAAGRVKTRGSESNVVSLPSEVTADRLLYLAEQNLKAAQSLVSAALELSKAENRSKK